MNPSEEQAIARLKCPGCGDWLAPARALFHEPSFRLLRDLACLGCRKVFPWREGILDMMDAREDGAIVRRFKLGADEHSFVGLLTATLRMARNSDRTFEDELYAMLSWLDPNPSQSVMLLGTAGGLLVPPLAHAIYPGPLIAVESDLQQLEQVHQKCVEEGVDNAVLVHGNLAQPPVRRASFDRLVMFGVLHGGGRPVPFVNRATEGLRHEGVVVGVSLARSILPRIASQQDRFGKSLGVNFLEMNEFGRDLCRDSFVHFQMDQPSNWMARFVVRKVAHTPVNGVHNGI